jgi:predicted NBD/HSP70 family sugar kinase
VPAVAVDLGGTFLRCAVSSDAGDISDLATQRLDRVPSSRDPQTVWEQLFTAIADFARADHAGLNAADPIALALPGPIADRARLIGAPTVVGRTGEIPDVVGIVRERTGRPVYLLNDVSAASWYFLTSERADRFLVVTVSSGIGSKLVDRAHPDRVLDGWSYSGEIGHLAVADGADAPLCDCGGRGHLGAIASGRGTENLARHMSRRDPASFLRSLCATSFGATLERLTNEEHLVPAALQGDPWAWSVITEAQEPLAQVLATAIVAASLQRVLVIGGFAVSLDDRYIDSLRASVQRRMTPGLIEVRIDDVIEFGRSPADACLRGAGLFAAAVARELR